MMGHNPQQKQGKKKPGRGKEKCLVHAEIGEGGEKSAYFNNCLILHVLFFLNTQNQWSEGLC